MPNVVCNAIKNYKTNLANNLEHYDKAVGLIGKEVIPHIRYAAIVEDVFCGKIEHGLGIMRSIQSLATEGSLLRTSGHNR